MIDDAFVPEFELTVHRQSWLRLQVREAVRHLPAPVQTADLLQVGVILLAQAVRRFNWTVVGPEEAAVLFVPYAQRRVLEGLALELQQIPHLNRSQRRRLLLLSMAMEDAWSESRSVLSLQQLSAATGLSLAEIDALERAADISVRQLAPDAQSPLAPPLAEAQLLAQTARHACGSRHREADGDAATESIPESTPETITPAADALDLPPATPAELLQARVDTAVLMEQLAAVYAGFSGLQRQVLREHLGLQVRRLPRRPGGAGRRLLRQAALLLRGVRVWLRRTLRPSHKRSADRLDPTGVLQHSYEQMLQARRESLEHHPLGRPWPGQVAVVLQRPAMGAAGAA